MRILLITELSTWSARRAVQPQAAQTSLEPLPPAALTGMQADEESAPQGRQGYLEHTRPAPRI
jgi:hypothetical protein